VAILIAQAFFIPSCPANAILLLALDVRLPIIVEKSLIDLESTSDVTSPLLVESVRDMLRNSQQTGKWIS
jgi:hypothetical protein